MRLQFWLLAALSVLVIGGVVAYKIWGPEPEFQPANPVGLGPPETIGKVEFKKSMFFQHGAVAIDEGPLKAIPCSKDPDPFATIKIEDNLEGDLTCVDDYLGGIKITYSVNGEIRAANIAQRDSDGGDDWDARSVLFHDDNGRLIIQTKTASSGEEIDEDDPDEPGSSPLECTMSVSAQVWDPEKKSFEPGPPSDDAPEIPFRPPINVAADCLNSDGTWKGR
jgi:hypothetical protein